MKFVTIFIESIGNFFGGALTQKSVFILLLLIAAVLFFTIPQLYQDIFSIILGFTLWSLCILFGFYVINVLVQKRKTVSISTNKFEKRIPENECDIIYDVLKKKGLFDITKISDSLSKEELEGIEMQISKDNFKNYLAKKGENFKPILLTTDQKKVGGLIFEMFAPKLDKQAKEIYGNFNYLKKNSVYGINYNSISSKSKRSNVQPILDEIEKILTQRKKLNSI